MLLSVCQLFSSKGESILRHTTDFMPGLPHRPVAWNRSLWGQRVTTQHAVQLHKRVTFGFVWLTSLPFSPVFAISFKNSWSSSKDICLWWILQGSNSQTNMLTFKWRNNLSAPSPWSFCLHLNIPRSGLIQENALIGNIFKKEGSRPVFVALSHAEQCDPKCFAWRFRDWLEDYTWKYFCTEGNESLYES